ncbi:MAG: hypothetical protein HYS24_01775 [Ignavibacteriales bacterium]|nr:hypothetical protein [Ignavibacteriales bacterium]
MKKMHKASILIFLLTFITSLTFAQETPEFSVKVGGLIQAWTSYGQINGADTNSLGWGIRRARLTATSNFGTKMKGIVQLELTSFKLLDAKIEYSLSNMFTLSAGRFIGAGVRGAGLTGAGSIDITERAYSADRWAANTIGTDFRDYGMDLTANIGELKANVTLHNGDGSVNLTNKVLGSQIQNGGFAVSGMLAYKPEMLKGLEVGGYYGIGNKEINEYSAYNAYAYFEPGKFKVKAEFIGWTNTIDNSDLSQMGYYLLGGYKILDCLEAIARYEIYDANTDLDDTELNFITVGATYSLFPSKWNAGKITAAYIITGEPNITVDNNVFQIVMQLSF